MLFAKFKFFNNPCLNYTIFNFLFFSGLDYNNFFPILFTLPSHIFTYFYSLVFTFPPPLFTFPPSSLLFLLLLFLSSPYFSYLLFILRLYCKVFLPPLIFFQPFYLSSPLFTFLPFSLLFLPLPVVNEHGAGRGAVLG